MTVRAELLSIGQELLMGEIVDTNAAFIAARLPPLGIELRWVTQVGDRWEDMTEALRRALSRSDITFTTGGLGPTQDDLTREAIADALGERLEVDPALVESLEAFFRGRGIPMPPSNLKQASLIPSAQPLPNRRGTAPGWWVEKDSRVIVALPGVPAELEVMWENEVLPRLKRLPRGRVIVTRTLKSIGISEAAVGEMVSHLFGQENPYLGIYARPDGIHLRLIARGRDEEEARALIAPLEEEIRRRLGPALWGVDRESPEERAGALLKALGATLATMESCTGGLLADTITNVPGSSDYFQGGLVTYTSEAKIAAGVDPSLIAAHGAVSPQVAEAMAQTARARFKADYGIGITGVAGPEPLEGKRVGTVYIGLAWEGESKSIEGRFPPQRHLVKRQAVTRALLELVRLAQERATG